MQSITYSTLQYKVVHYSRVQYNAEQYTTIQYVTIQYNTGDDDTIIWNAYLLHKVAGLSILWNSLVVL